MQEIIDIFSKNGGQFISDTAEFTDKIKNIKAILFDWDGVFNDSAKAFEKPNGFSEADSMGINLLRYSFFEENKFLPAAIISGEKNQTALQFAEREKFNQLYFKIKSKRQALHHFCNLHQISPNEIAWFFDDVLDISIAQEVGVRFYFAKPFQPLTNRYMIDNNLCDYIPSVTNGTGSIRECTELIMGIKNGFNQVVIDRSNVSKNYMDYLEEKGKQSLQIFTATKENEIIVSEF